jgi:hypothetical protein
MFFRRHTPALHGTCARGKCAPGASVEISKIPLIIGGFDTSRHEHAGLLNHRVVQILELL